MRCLGNGVSRGGSFAVLLLSFGLLALPALAAGPLFPRPLQLTRVVDNPSGGEPTIIEEYYSGFRVVSVVGQRTVIADYEKQEILEIDRAASTYSVTSFEQLAQATASTQATVRATTGASS